MFLLGLDLELNQTGLTSNNLLPKEKK